MDDMVDYATPTTGLSRWFHVAGRVTRSMRSRETMLYALQTVSFLGGHFPRLCPICGYEGMFRAAGQPPRYDARCTGCGSLERHRLLFLRLASGEINGGTLLHFAPETIFREVLPKLVDEYITADLYADNVTMKLDIQDIELGSMSIDTIVCNHVLEHVDDERALPELFRVLRPGGKLYCMVPIVEGWQETYENPGVENKPSRTLHFGQQDHVRYYGADFRTRLSRAGFVVTEMDATGEETARFGLVRGETVFVGQRPE